MNHRWKALPITVGLALVLAACGGDGATSTPGGSEAPDASAGPSQAGNAGGTMVFAGARLAASLDPSQTSDGESFRILQQIYEPLIDLEPGSTNELTGVLAETWEGEAADDTYVFHLRQGVTFHDGTPFNAEAVKTNFDRWQNLPEELQANAYYYDLTMDGFGPDNLISSVEATDEHTVTITLREPSATFLYAITLPPFAIVSPAVLESTNADDPAASTFGTEEVQGGTGPFVLQSYTPDENATLVRNENYWGTPALLDRLIIRPIADPAARLQALQAGSIHAYDLVSPTDYGAVEDGGFQLVERLSFNSLYLAITPTATEGGPLAELPVRQAVAAAIDKQALLDTFYGGRGSVADNFIPPSSGWYDAVAAGVEPDVFDPDAARQLLADAGYGPDNPPEVEFWYPTEVTRPYMPDPRGLHEAVTQMLEDVGFVVTPNSDIWDIPGYLEDAQGGLYDMHFLGWTGDWDDPGNWYGVHFGFSQGEPNPQFNCDVEGLEEAIDTAEAELDETARGEAWAEVARIVHENVCFVTLVHGDTALALRPEVQGYLANPTGSESFATVWLDEGA
ncbi:MAG TPA: ABC transporter substrate-binding protein [Candidatus Limnocylindria bacterium]